MKKTIILIMLQTNLISSSTSGEVKKFWSVGKYTLRIEQSDVNQKPNTVTMWQYDPYYHPNIQGCNTLAPLENTLALLENRLTLLEIYRCNRNALSTTLEMGPITLEMYRNLRNRQ